LLLKWRPNPNMICKALELGPHPLHSFSSCYSIMEGSLNVSSQVSRSLGQAIFPCYPLL
jgi:hypothetical protein